MPKIIYNFFKVENPISTLQGEISKFPFLHRGKKNNFQFVLDKLKRISNYKHKGWLETIGRTEAFLGRMLFVNNSWIQAIEHFKKAINYLKDSRTVEGNYVITMFWVEFLLCKFKIRKQIKQNDVKNCIYHNQKILCFYSLRYAQILELLSRIVFKKKKTKTMIQILKTALMICKKEISNPQSQIISLNIDKQLSNVFYQRKMLRESLRYQKFVNNNPLCKIGDKAISQYSMALIYYLQDKVKKSEKQLDLVIPIFESLENDIMKHKRKYNIIRNDKIMYNFSGTININGLKNILKNSRRLKIKINKIKNKRLIENSDNLIDRENITKINKRKINDVRFKVQKLGPMCEFLGDGLEKILL